MRLNSRLRIFFRTKQIVYEGNNVIVQCNGDGTAVYVPGSNPDTQWIEMTKFTEGLDKLHLEWSQTSSGNADGGETNEAGSNFDKGISLDLTFRGDAFDYIFAWLWDSPCALLNAIDVRLFDELCQNEYRLFELKADNISYRPIDVPCEFTVKLREQDLIWHCVHKNFIYDNWQNWFANGSLKQHPCFVTCVEPRPRLIASARLALLMFGLATPIIPPFLPGLGDNSARKILGLDNFVPSPLVRTYLENICGKCNLSMDTMFDDLPDNAYRNLCVFYPLAGKSFWHENDGSSIMSPALWFFFENRWLVTLADFLDKIKDVFAAEWYVTPNNTLIFKPQIDFNNAAAIYDYTAPGARSLYELEYTFDGTKKPAYGRYQYQPDGPDMASQEISPLYNDLIDFDGPANNPMLEGEQSHNFDFAPTGFVRDGRSEDYTRQLVNDAETGSYILLAVLSVVVAALLPGVFTTAGAIILGASVLIWVLNISSRANSWRNAFGDWDTFYTGCVRITTDQVSVPRLLLWDGVSMTQAKVVNQAVPDPDPYYNPALTPYTDRNAINDHGIVFNYPMYFDGFYKENLFGRFHSKIDNPLLSLDTHQNFTFKEDLCCEVMDLYGLWQNDFAKIGYVIKIQDMGTYSIFGRIGNIDVDYDDEKVIIKGKMFKRLN